MGGILLTETEAIIRETALLVQFSGAISWPIWFIGVCAILVSAKRHWIPAQFAPDRSTSVSVSLWTMSILALLLWVFILPFSQPPQQLRRTAEADLQNDRIEFALREMSAHERQEFPTHWDPPPWPGYGQDSPPLLQVLQAMAKKPNADWVKEIYLDKLARQIGHRPSSYNFLHSMDDDEFDSYMTILQNTPTMHDAVRKNSEIFLRLLEYESDEKGTRKPQLRSLLIALDIDIPEVDTQDDDNSATEVEQAVESPAE